MLADFAILLYLIEQGGWLSTIFTPILSGGLLFAMGLLIVVYCRFIAELHQFKSAGYVFFISLAVALGFALVASLVFVSLGFYPRHATIIRRTQMSSRHRKNPQRFPHIITQSQWGGFGLFG